MSRVLAAHPLLSAPKGPVVLAILDGVGEGLRDAGDAVHLARTPVLDGLRAGPFTSLNAHGTFVGLPSDGDMGNSEVGHNALGCGQVHDQGASLVGKAIDSGSLFEGEVWTAMMARVASKERAALHFVTLLSDGNVHSHIDHLLALLKKAAAEGCKRLYVHALLDGRDVPPQSAMTYVEILETTLAELREAGIDARVASGGGRMTITMDRYGADWDMVERGWRAHVLGEAEQRFASLAQAVETLRKASPDICDQDLPGFVIVDAKGDAVAPVRDGDALILTNFRGDRALELSQAFDDDDFPHFDRQRRPDVLYAGMMEYDGDEHIPKRYLVSPPLIENTMGQWLAENKVTQLAISETQKFGHVTYFWNGNQGGMFDEDSETYIEIPSDRIPFEQRPWMKAAEITDRLITELRTGSHRFARVNYANGDMVGHTGNLEATITAMQVVDFQLGRLREAVHELGGVLLVTADHGNADEMVQHDKKGKIVVDPASKQPMVKTSHTLNQVPFMISDSRQLGASSAPYALDDQGGKAGIANITATCLELLGYAVPPGMLPSLLRFQ